MRLVWYRFAHWLQHSPLVLVLGLTLLGVALGLIGTSSNWPATANRDEILAGLGFIFGGALVLLSTSLTRVVFGQAAFASGLYSPRVAASLLARPLVIWTTGLFTAALTCAGSAWLAQLNDGRQLSVLPLAVSVALLAVSLLGFLALIFSVTRTYRVSRVVSDTARAGLRAVDRLYPLTVDEVDAGRLRAAPRGRSARPAARDLDHGVLHRRAHVCRICVARPAQRRRGAAQRAAARAQRRAARGRLPRVPGADCRHKEDLPRLKRRQRHRPHWAARGRPPLPADPR